MKNLNVKLVLTGVIACLTVLMLALAGSCGKSKATSPSSSVEPASMSVKSVLSRRNIPPLEELLAELDALDKPPEVDGALWASLKADMRDWLIETFGKGKGASKYPPNYDLENPDETSATHDYVKPRDLQWEKREDDPDEETFGKITWRYANDGDYDENGVVSISDITPLAMHHGEWVDEDNSIQELIDEDDDPYDNGDWIVDVEEDGYGYHNDFETIQRCFFVDIAQYEVFGSEDGVNWDHLAYIDFSERSVITDERDKFEYNLEYGNYQVYKVRALSAGPPGEYGEYWWHSDPNDPEGSIVEAEIVLGPPVITDVKPEAPQGPPNTPITFEATVEGPTPYTYTWTFGPHADPPQSQLKSPSVTFDQEFTGTGVLAVLGRFGSDVYGFPIEIKEEMAPIIDSVSPSPAEGDAEDKLTFSADVRGSEPLAYAWDFGGGATPNTSSDESPTVTLGTPGPPYSANLTVTNDFGEDAEDFDLTVHGWVIETIDENPYAEFTSLAFASDGNPGICYYSWSEKSVRYMKFNGNEWTEEALLPTDSGDFTSLAYDSDGTAYVAYMMDPPDDVPALALAWQEGAEWLHVIIDTDHAGHSLSLSLHPVTEEPAISYVKCQASEGDLLYAHMVDHEWLIEDVGGATACTRGTSLAFTPVTCNPAISFCHNITGSALVYAWKNDGDWQLEAVDYGPVEAGLGQYSCLRFGPNDEPSISYLHAWNTELRYATKYGGNWGDPEVVDGEGFGPPRVGEWTSMVFDADDKAVISYTEYCGDLNYALKVARQTGGQPEWNIETVDSAYEVGKYTSIAIGPYGSIGVSYGGYELRFAQLW